jgi:hypothetical protein
MDDILWNRFALRGKGNALNGDDDECIEQKSIAGMHLWLGDCIG